MVKFFIEPGYNVKAPERDYGNAGIDFFIPEYSESFVDAFENIRQGRKLTYGV